VRVFEAMAACSISATATTCGRDRSFRILTSAETSISEPSPNRATPGEGSVDPEVSHTTTHRKGPELGSSCLTAGLPSPDTRALALVRDPSLSTRAAAESRWCV
jgi:hypothetical protein